MDSISAPISNASLAIGPNRDGNQDQGSPSSIAEFLNELENELANAVPWTCPNRLKVVLGRIAMKVQKDKPTMEERADRIKILTQISIRPTILKGFITLCDTNDPSVAINLILILREAIQAKTSWRGSTLVQILKVNATEAIGKLLVRVHKMQIMQHQPLADHILICMFWILSALATKDCKFSSTCRNTGLVKIINPILKGLASKPSQLYSILQVIKALSRNSITATILGKDLIATFANKVIPKMAAHAEKKGTFVVKLRVALETLHYLTKPKPNQLILIRQRLTGDLLNILSRLEVLIEPGRNLIKIAGSILSVFLHLVPSRTGRQQFTENCGVEVLKRFCFNLAAEKVDRRWDRLLCRSCVILSRCCPSSALPVASDGCPIKFDIPREHSFLPEEATSSSDATSRETTPESDDENDDEEQDDDEDDDAFADEDTTYNRNDTVNDDSIPLKDYQANPIRDVEELMDSYRRLFPEYEDGWKKSRTENNSSDIPFNEKTERKSYIKNANRIKSQMRFKKVAYPDYIGAETQSGVSEPLLEKNRSACRAKVLQNLRIILNEVDEYEQNVVYDLDELIIRDENNDNNKPRELRADDDFLIFTNQTASDDTPWDQQKRKHLIFESRFECGNLRKAIQIRDREYNLVLNPDVNSYKHHQWFYFQVSNMVSGEHAPYIFNIINYEKTNSQFNFGMQPVMFSVKEAMAGRPYWKRIGSDICYYKNNFSKSVTVCDDEPNFMTASFTVTFPHDGDICYFAYHFPYTYSKLLTHIEALQQKEQDGMYMKVSTLGHTVKGHEIPFITITAPINDVVDDEDNFTYFDNTDDEDSSGSMTAIPNIPICDRRVIVLSSRVHPGETNASWIMHGLLDYLTSQSKEAQLLRMSYVFKIIPMLNIEGVIHGNHRCGLSGDDLNRRWRSPNEKLHPSIYHAKGALSYIKQVLNKDIFLYCDFHGHSRKKNMFLYGCSSMQSWWPMDQEYDEDPSIFTQLEEVLIGKALCFDRRSCRYNVDKCRESTGRVVVWREFETIRSYTMESSFCGMDRGAFTGYQISTNHLLDTGAVFVRSLLQLEHSEDNEYDDRELYEYSTKLQCKTSVEKDNSMKITRLVISMPTA